MHYFYVIYSAGRDRYYYGSSHDPELRLRLHNEGATRSTKSGIPWRLVYTESYEEKSAALKREREIKRMKSRQYTEQLIASHASG